MVATDSYRLEREGDDARRGRSTGSLEANVPARTLQELGRIASAGSAEAIGVAALENQVVFTVDDVVLSSRLVEGRFPNYQQLLPETYEHELRVNRDELLEVVRRVGLLAQKNAPLRLSFTEGALDVSAQTPDVGEASESLPVPFAGRTARDRLQPGVLPRRPRERGVGRAGPEADQPAAARPDPVRRRGRRLPLSRHADPSERVGRSACASTRVAAARLPQLRARGRRARRRADRGRRPERRRQDEPARGALLRLHRRARRAPRTSASWCGVAARASRAWWSSSTAPTTARTASRSASQPGEAKHLRVDGSAGGQPGRGRGAAARERVPARAARAREGRAGRAPRASRPARRRALAGAARRRAPPTRARSRSATRSWPGSAPAPRGPAAARRLGRRARPPRDPR